MTREDFARKVNKILPGESNKRTREAIILAFGGASSVAREVKDEIDFENRTKTGVINKGILAVITETSATLNDPVWVIDYEIFQSEIEIGLTILPKDAAYPRPDYIIGKNNGTVEYRPSTLDSNGNSFPPSVNLDEIVLQIIQRNIDGTNTESTEIGFQRDLGVDATASILSANAPSSTNPFATLADLIASSATPISQIFTFSTSNIFNLSHPGATALLVTLNGQVLQEGPSYDWVISASQLSVTTPLTIGDEISILYYVALPRIVLTGRNFDGGAPDSVYLPIQKVDGGTP